MTAWEGEGRGQPKQGVSGSQSRSVGNPAPPPTLLVGLSALLRPQSQFGVGLLGRRQETVSSLDRSRFQNQSRKSMFHCHWRGCPVQLFFFTDPARTSGQSHTTAPLGFPLPPPPPHGTLALEARVLGSLWSMQGKEETQRKPSQSDKGADERATIGKLAWKMPLG